MLVSTRLAQASKAGPGLSWWSRTTPSTTGPLASSSSCRSPASGEASPTTSRSPEAGSTGPRSPCQSTCARSPNDACNGISALLTARASPQLTTGSVVSRAYRDRPGGTWSCGVHADWFRGAAIAERARPGGGRLLPTIPNNRPTVWRVRPVGPGHHRGQAADEGERPDERVGGTRSAKHAPRELSPAYTTPRSQAGCSRLLRCLRST